QRMVGLERIEGGAAGGGQRRALQVEWDEIALFAEGDPDAGVVDLVPVGATAVTAVEPQAAVAVDGERAGLEEPAAGGDGNGRRMVDVLPGAVGASDGAPHGVVV